MTKVRSLQLKELRIREILQEEVGSSTMELINDLIEVNIELNKL